MLHFTYHLNLVREMQIDDFIKWTSNDDNGSFTHVGQIKMFHGDTVIFETESDGMMGIHKNDGTFVSIKKPKGWNKPKSFMVPLKGKRKTSDAITKKEQALALVRDTYGKGHGRDVAVQRIIDVLGMSKAGATTYFYNAKKVVDQGR